VLTVERHEPASASPERRAALDLPTASGNEFDVFHRRSWSDAAFSVKGWHIIDRRYQCTRLGT